MARSKQWYLLCYDIRDAKRLQKVARLLEGAGYRLQYSVFRCHLTRRELERLNWELKRVTEPEDDILVISLCHTCIQHLGTRHPEQSWATPEIPHFEII
jgi:CRISPR-associated protein Cas2